ncbi:hypothetical protein TIFTF001_038514 [Ficus carica]|uniref:Uncharacterized protein n=1 Tax=Ficus carica TaxID=3494 RepID=A0AA88E7D6_FICCA|nr:hypothetical protein TIFTF001_037408 [Ficus carica]GMN69462.1 hypothetical protein TIFTF001_038513 [Ficus carica]GMN69463.1 hypothetical protein TIFTF001_038514 [Ficus carica]
MKGGVHIPDDPDRFSSRRQKEFTSLTLAKCSAENSGIWRPARCFSRSSKAFLISAIRALRAIFLSS